MNKIMQDRKDGYFAGIDVITTTKMALLDFEKKIEYLLLFQQAPLSKTVDKIINMF